MDEWDNLEDRHLQIDLDDINFWFAQCEGKTIGWRR